MANQEHVDILKQGVEAWNEWRKEHRNIKPNFGHADLSGAYLSGAYLSGANLYDAYLVEAKLSGTNLSGANLTDARLRGIDLSDINLAGANLNGADLYDTVLEEADLSDIDLAGANLSDANLYEANLIRANLNGANLSDAWLIRANFSDANLEGANLERADLEEANLERANLRDTDLEGANLSDANLHGADLTRANLERANLIDTNLTNTNLTGCQVFGISAWNVNLEGAIQKDLVITDYQEPKLTVDNLEVAQFIYLLLNNSKIRDVINTITSKVVLILGRFTDERKLVLDALRDELRNYNLSPVVFDFDPSTKRDLTETISTLAHMSRFIIADLTDAKSIPQELQAIVPHLPSVPVQPILHVDAKEYSMFEHYERYPWVLPIYRYQEIPSLLTSIKEHIIKPVEQKEHEREKAQSFEEEIKALKEKIKELEGRK